MATAVRDERVLLTFDRDYGDLIFHHGQPVPVGVILFRLTGPSPQDDNRRMLQILQTNGDWFGKFTTITDTLIRSRNFPKSNE